MDEEGEEKEEEKEEKEEKHWRVKSEESAHSSLPIGDNRSQGTVVVKYKS